MDLTPGVTSSSPEYGYIWNNWNSKINHINQYNSRVLSISSKCVNFIDDSYKSNIVKFISSVFFENKMINETIKNVLYD
jgi:hypothetical protein